MRSAASRRGSRSLQSCNLLHCTPGMAAMLCST